MTAARPSRILLATGTAAVAALALAACDVRVIETDGETATETRAVGDFHEIQVEGAGDLEVRVGEELSVTVTADTAVLEHLTATVSDGVLTIDGPAWVIGGDSDDVQWDIQVPSLDSLEIAGSTDTVVTGIDGEGFALSLAGSGDIELEGEVDVVDIDLAGSGTIDAEDLEATNATVNLAGSGDITVYATEMIDVDLAGSGDITHLGPAKVSSDILGSGNVTAG